MSYYKQCYWIIKEATKDMDAVYEDYITHLIGVTGLAELQHHNLLEPCGIVQGRQLYTLLDK
jgi:hypothetical protein